VDGEKEKEKTTRLDEAVAESRFAVGDAESAFFDPTMVSLLYFPDEHKYAVYMPLFTPISGMFCILYMHICTDVVCV
jgi:hypothetical protein